LGANLERSFAVPPRSQRSHRVGDEEIEATSIETFCRRHGFSVAPTTTFVPKDSPRAKPSSAAAG
jgi:hypothetical protein